MSDDTISRQAAINALWKALHDYEDKTEKQFQESDELDVWDWINHREFVQGMNDIDRATILNLPSTQPELNEWCHDCKEYDKEHHCCPRWNRVIKTALEDAQPEIIRCKDCRWWDKYGDYDHGYCMAAKHGYWSEHWDISIRRTYKGDFYCADAEPKGEQE